jgi:hypothetical protein
MQATTPSSNAARTPTYGQSVDFFLRNPREFAHSFKARTVIHPAQNQGWRKC